MRAAKDFVSLPSWSDHNEGLSDGHNSVCVFVMSAGHIFHGRQEKLEAALAALDATLKTSTGKRYDKLVGQSLLINIFRALSNAGGRFLHHESIRSMCF